MIENALSGIGGIGVLGVISLGIFFVFFAGMLFWAARLKKSYLNSMCELPLDDQDLCRGKLSNPEENHEK